MNTLQNPRVALYCRVSTDKQTQDSQLTELREFCHRREWSRVTEFQDIASGAKFSRDALDRMLTEIRAGRFDLLLCFKLDRLGRSLTHLAQIVGELTRHRVALVCSSQGIDTSDSNPAGRLQLGVLMAVAEFEREMIRERVQAGLRAARAKGRRLGRPGTLNARQDEVLELSRAGQGIREISRQLGMPPSSVIKVLKTAAART